MNTKILKRLAACGCLALALFGVAKGEGEKKKPILMKQMACAVEISDQDLDDDIFVSAEGEEYQVVESEEEEKAEEKVQTIEYEEEQGVCIAVFGKAHVSAAPDSAVIFARIETLDKDINASKENNFDVFDRVMSALTAKGAEEQNVKLEFFGCQPSYDYNSGKSLNGYYSTTSFSVVVPEIAEVKDYIEILTEEGVTAIDNICYKVSDIDAKYNEALSSAIENAKVKAKQMLGTDQLSLVKLKEEYVYSSNNLCRRYSDGLAPTDYLGQVEIEAQVKAVFEK